MRARAFLAPVLAAGIGLLAGTLLAACFGAPPGRFLALLLGGTLGSGYGIGQVLFKATPLLFAGLAAALPFRAGLFNIGAEGQMTIGGFAMALVGIHLAGVPGPWLWCLCILAAAAAGGLWGGIAGFLKARTGAHEVIVTILLNFVALALANYFLSTFYALPDTVRTADLGRGAWMARAFDAIPFFLGSGLSTAFLLALAVTFACDLLLLRTPLGFHWRILGGGVRRAVYARLRPGRLTILSMVLGGALAGMGSSSFVLGYKHCFEEGFAGGTGFLGIAVALLARNRPLALIPSALLFGLLAHGGLAVNALVPREIVDIVSGVILIVFILLDARAREGESRWIFS
jgi:simple sugar transport system permease protein